jgi:uncharacterized protein
VASTEAAARGDQDTIVITPDLVIPRRALQHLASHHHIRRLCLFGSAARGELRPDSDIDLLVEFEPGQAPSLWTAQEVEMDLSRLFGGRPVDMVSPEILRNPYRRKQIEKDLKVLHEAS